MKLTKVEQVETLVKRARDGERVKVYFVFTTYSNSYMSTYPLDKTARIEGDKLQWKTGLASIFGQAIWYDNYWEAWAHCLRAKKHLDKQEASA